MKTKNIYCCRKTAGWIAVAAVVLLPATAFAIGAEERFAALDRDSSGSLSWEEFSAVNSSISRQGFDRIDLNQDGEISLEEWRIFSGTHGMSIPLGSETSRLPAQDVVPPVVLPPDHPQVEGVPAPQAVSPAPAASLPLVRPPRIAQETTLSRPQEPVAPTVPQVQQPTVPAGQ